MLPRQPLRFVLADDPGAGKTVMAGLYIRELMLRADAQRVVIVAPGSLVEQWRDELFEKFGLDFHVFSSALEQSSAAGNPFEAFPRLIVRLDQMSRNDDLQSLLCAAEWDLAVFDEAHKLAAHYSGAEVRRTQRFSFAENLGQHTRHLLLMTATPHSGKEEDFQLFLSLLDSDRFYGSHRDGAHKVDVSDLMRRMVKEELVKFDGTSLFPERRAYTVNYTLSDLEATLYEAVTQYVKGEMGKADQLDGQRRGSVGLALTTLQRRLASSPEAIYQSLKRRHARLAERLREERLSVRGILARAETLAPIPDAPDDLDELTGDEQEVLEETMVDESSAARSIAELETEIRSLQTLEQMAHRVVDSGQDRKWEELSRLLQNTPAMQDADGRQRKLIIFTEHRDTLNYLHHRIGNLLGNTDAVVTIHGGTHRDERRRVQALFRSDKDVRVLVATDAAGEGVNLQFAHLMVNYDLPWNPNRLEQRFGRIHRIGQTEVCHLWSLVASETREGSVWRRLLDKLAIESAALKGKVFNILGDVFEDVSLRDLMIEAIRAGDEPQVRARLTQQVDDAFDRTHLLTLLDRSALAGEAMTPERLFRVKEEMDKAEARRLQPYYVRTFFEHAFKELGGSMRRREAERWEVAHVPRELLEIDRRITGRNPREQEPVLKRYDRICFERSAVQPLDKPGAVRAVLMHPGHPLMLSTIDAIQQKYAGLLRRGTLLIDETDLSEEPWMLFLLTHEIKSSPERVLSRRLQFVRVNADGAASFAGWAPHLDLLPASDEQRAQLRSLLEEPWLGPELETHCMTFAATRLAPDHFDEVRRRRLEDADRTWEAVHERLTREIHYWTDREIALKEDRAAGKDVRIALESIGQRLQDMMHRLDKRRRELIAMKHVQNTTPVVHGCALVVPQGCLNRLAGRGAVETRVDADARRRVELLAMRAVMDAERAQGRTVVDVSAENCGWDVTSYPPPGSSEPLRHIEVKGLAAGSDTVTVTFNEVRYAVNQGDKFVLALVFVHPDGRVDAPHMLSRPFRQEPEWTVASQTYRVDALLGLTP
jgi:superfamily II DNA or RNA helicase